MKNFIKPYLFSFFLAFFSFFNSLFCTNSVCIVIPAYNEENRIERTLLEYVKYFSSKPEKTTFLVVANNCKDNTVGVVQKVQKDHKNIVYIDLKPGGKGFAIKEGFIWALERNFDLIGFVDADMATEPQYFYDLIIANNKTDGAIASRYISGATVSPSRPLLRKLGGKFYNWLLRTRLGINFKDTQCGAKIFNRDTVLKITPHLQEKGWAIDLELLYLCKLFAKSIAEIATTWSDQPGTHLVITSRLMKEFLNSPTRIKERHEFLKKDLQKKKKLKNKNYKFQKTKNKIKN
jgi:glycosyltransferase involved in cell wall biosynthesis